MKDSKSNAVEVVQKASRAAVALGLRQVLVQLLNVMGGVLLARLLSPADYGLLGVCLFVLAFLTAFGDAGLGASLIRQQQTPRLEEYRVVFTVQQTLVSIIGALFWLLSPWVLVFYQLPPDQIWVFRAVAAAFFVTSFQTTSTIRMERNLAFDRLAVVEVAQAVVFNVAAVLLALGGFGAVGIGLAILMRSLTGAILANVLERWPMGWCWDPQLIKDHLAFGVPYQASNILNLLKDMINPVWVGAFAGASAVGYINWATTFANYPLIFVMLFSRLVMPVLSKLTSDLVAFNKILNAIVKILCGFVYPATAILYLFRYEIVEAIFGVKWLPALVLFAPFVLITMILAPTIVGIGALNSLGHSKFVFFMTVVWLLLTWIIGGMAIPRWGWPVWGWVNFAVNVSNVLVLHRVSALTGFSWLHALLVPALMMGICGLTAQLLLAMRVPAGVALAVVVLEMVLLMFGFMGRELRKILANLGPPKDVFHAA